MKTKTTLLILIAGCALFGFMRLYEVKHLPTRMAAYRKAYLLPFDPDAIEGILITRYGDSIELRRNGSRWELETRTPLKAAIKDHADQKAVIELLARCATLRQEEILNAKNEDAKRLGDYGFTNSNLRLKLLGRNAPPELFFGKETTVTGKGFVRLAGKDNVYVTNDELRSLIVRKADVWRDHRLAGLDPALATRLLFKTAAGEIALSKTGDHWGLDKPIKSRADDMRTTELIGDILNTQVSAFPDNVTLSGCGLSEPRGSVTIWPLGETTPVTLQIGAHDDPTDQAYACLSNRDAIFMLPKQIERILTLLPDEMRDRHLLRVDMDMVDRLSIDASGKSHVVLQRRQEDWVRLDRGAQKPVNTTKVQSLVKTLQTRRIDTFVADVASDLPKYGLDRPQLRVAFSSYASENTAESSAGEHPLLTVDFGNADGNVVYARVEDEPSIVSVDKSILDEISADPEEWRPLPVYRFNPEEIIALEVMRAANGGAPETTSLKRSGTAWHLADAQGMVESINVQSLVNTLSKLSAVRWTGADIEALKAPTETIAFRTADGKSGKLVMGASSDNSGCHAMIDGDTAAFVISAPDESALRLPLVSR